jgi:hypothetical protein
MTGPATTPGPGAAAPERVPPGAELPGRCDQAAFVAFRVLFGARLRAWFRLRIEGAPPVGPCVLVANHTSFLDPLLLGASQRARIVYLMTEVVWRSRLGVTDHFPEGQKNTGRASNGGPIVTASGLTFIAGTDDARLPKVLQNTSGFVYYVSVTGITGSAIPDYSKVAGAVARIKRHTELPIAVGFGVKNAETAEIIARGADGVVVGSALVEAVPAWRLWALCDRPPVASAAQMA